MSSSQSENDSSKDSGTYADSNEQDSCRGSSTHDDESSSHSESQENSNVGVAVEEDQMDARININDINASVADSSEQNDTSNQNEIRVAIDNDDDGDDDGDDDDNDKLVYCSICMDDQVRQSLMVVNSRCGHSFCGDCVNGLVRARLMDGHASIECMASECGELLPDALIDALVCDDDELREKLARWKRFDEIRRHPSGRWCPRVGCGNGVIGDPATNVCECDECQMCFCFGCGANWQDHDGMSCDEYRDWARRHGKVDVKTERWKRRHKTIECPQCKAVIEKLPGTCNHVECTACMHGFCVLCMRPMTDSHYDANIGDAGCPNQCFSFGQGRSRRSRMAHCGKITGAVCLALICMLPALLIGLPIYACYRCFK
jgi:IBR domain/IBR domain, a half RING-finger domain